MQSGFLVTGLIGSGVNIVNGDYSRGANGFWIENGEIAYPVNEVTVAGNLAEMFSKIQKIGNLAAASEVVAFVFGILTYFFGKITPRRFRNRLRYQQTLKPQHI